MFGVTKLAKTHIILTPISQFNQLTEDPLGPYLEQALEDAHSMFQVYWDRNLIKNFKSASYISRYSNKRAILTMNFSNI